MMRNGPVEKINSEELSPPSGILIAIYSQLHPNLIPETGLKPKQIVANDEMIVSGRRTWNHLQIKFSSNYRPSFEWWFVRMKKKKPFFLIESVWCQSIRMSINYCIIETTYPAHHPQRKGWSLHYCLWQQSLARRTILQTGRHRHNPLIRHFLFTVVSLATNSLGNCLGDELSFIKI